MTSDSHFFFTSTQILYFILTWNPLYTLDCDGPALVLTAGPPWLMLTWDTCATPAPTNSIGIRWNGGYKEVPYQYKSYSSWSSIISPTTLSTAVIARFHCRTYWRLVQKMCREHVQSMNTIITLRNTHARMELKSAVATCHPFAVGYYYQSKPWRWLGSNMH